MILSFATYTPPGQTKCNNCKGRGWLPYINPFTYDRDGRSQCLVCFGDGLAEQAVFFSVANQGEAK